MSSEDHYQRMMTRNAAAARLRARLECDVIRHKTMARFEEKFVSALAAREQLLAAGRHEVQGACLLGSPGAGKTTVMARVIADHHAWFRTAPARRFGHRVVSVTTPAGAGVKETLKVILMATNGCSVRINRTEDYLFSRVIEAFREERVAALHLDEFQDLGRSKADGPMRAFVTRLRHLTQNRSWPVCLFLSGTPDAKQLINKVPSLARRLAPVEFQPVSHQSEIDELASHITALSSKAEIDVEHTMFREDHFLEHLAHAGAYSFGLIIQIIISALCEAALDAASGKATCLSYMHFIRAYDWKSDAGDDFNPFLADNWSVIDTRRVTHRGESAKQ